MFVSTRVSIHVKGITSRLSQTMLFYFPYMYRHYFDTYFNMSLSYKVFVIWQIGLPFLTSPPHMLASTYLEPACHVVPGTIQCGTVVLLTDNFRLPAFWKINVIYFLRIWGTYECAIKTWDTCNWVPTLSWFREICEIFMNSNISCLKVHSPRQIIITFITTIITW